MNILIKAGAAIALAATMLAAPAKAQNIELTLGHVAPPQTTYQDAAVRFADRLGELSDGSMSVNIVPGAALGGLGELWAQTRSSALDLHLIDIGAMIAMKEARQFLVLWAPFLFRDQAHFHRYIDSDEFAGMMSKAEADTGVVYLGYVGDRPPRVVTTRETAVTTPDDLKGLKIRTPQHPMIIGAFEAWGATPTPLGAAELLISLKTGVVDGQDNGLIDFVGAGYADANKQFAPINYIHSGVGIWMSPDRWAAMSDEQKGWLKQAAREAGEAGKEIHEKMMEDTFAKLDGLGVAVSSPDMDAFKTAVQPMIKGMTGKAWPEGAYGSISGL